MKIVPFFWLIVTLCSNATIILPYHILASWKRIYPQSFLEFSKGDKDVSKAPVELQSRIYIWQKRRLVWRHLGLLSPLESVRYPYNESSNSICLNEDLNFMIKWHIKEMIKESEKFTKPDDIMMLWTVMQLSVKELVESLITLKLVFEDHLSDASYFDSMLSVLSQFERKFAHLERLKFGASVRGELYSSFLKTERTSTFASNTMRAVLLTTQGYNLMKKLTPRMHYSRAHLEDFFRCCNKVMTSLNNRFLSSILAAKMEESRLKWFDNGNDDPTWSTWYGLPVPMQKTICGIRTKHPLEALIAEKYWKIHLKGLFLIFTSPLTDPYSLYLKHSSNLALKLKTLFHDLKFFLNFVDPEMDKLLIRLYDQIALLYGNLQDPNMRKALSSFIGFRRLKDFNNIEEWRNQLCNMLKYTEMDIQLQSAVSKLFEELANE